MPRRLAVGYPAETPPSAQNRHFRPPSADPAESMPAAHIGGYLESFVYRAW